MVVKWKSGHPDRMVAAIRQSEALFMDEAVKIVTESVEEGQAEQRKVLDEVTTRYGELRFNAGRGNSAGRNDTGNMIDKVTTGVEVDGNVVRGFWGWDNIDPHDDEYIAIQERTAQSLWASWIPTREAFFRRIARATKKGF